MSRVIFPLELRSERVGGVERSVFSACRAASCYVMRGPNVIDGCFCRRLFSEAASRAKLGKERRNIIYTKKNSEFR